MAAADSIAFFNAADMLSPAASPRAIARALVEAAGNGHVDIVATLLVDGRANPAADDSLALRQAAYYGHLGVVRALLSDGRADPAAENSYALWCAAGRGDAGIVAALLANGRADPATRRGVVLRVAAFLNKEVVLRLLLVDGRVDDASVAEDAWVAASHLHARRPYTKAIVLCLACHARWVRRRRWLRAGSAGPLWKL
jgi:hypothetical protein